MHCFDKPLMSASIDGYGKVQPKAIVVCSPTALEIVNGVRVGANDLKFRQHLSVLAIVVPIN